MRIGVFICSIESTPLTVLLSDWFFIQVSSDSRSGPMLPLPPMLFGHRHFPTVCKTNSPYSGNQRWKTESAIERNLVNKF